MEQEMNVAVSINTLPLTLHRRQSVLDGLVLLEKVPIVRLRALMKSNLLLMSWGEDYNWDFHKKLIMEQYANEKEQIGCYMKGYNAGLGAISVKYGKPKHKWGRSFPFKSLGLSCIRKVIRNSIIDGFYYDLDISNAQPNIIRCLCESNSIPCPIIKRYCEERKQIMEMVANHYKVSEDTAKELFIRLCFFGSFVGWCMENKLSNVKPLEFITLFERELKDLAERVKKDNPVLYETARKKKEDSGENKDNKILGSFFALYNQEYESRIVEAVLCYLINQTDLMKLTGTQTPVGAYEYDGIKLLVDNVNKFEGGLNGVIDLLNEKTYELTGFQLEWVSKPFKDTYNLDEWVDLVQEEAEPNEELLKDCNRITDTIANADAGICELLMELKPDHYIYSVDKSDGSKGDWYGWNGSRWERSDAPLRKAVIYEVERYWKGIMKKWDEYYAEFQLEEGETDLNYEYYTKTKRQMTDAIINLKKSVGIQSVCSVARTLMANYNLEFDTNPDLFGCENGVIDIAEECFRNYRFDDFVTQSCGYNFTPNLIEGFKVEVEGGWRFVGEAEYQQDPKASAVYEHLQEIYTQIFPDEELRKYFFKVISTGMSGKAIEKFFVFNGAGRNGKGLTNEFLQVVLGSYFQSISPVIFIEDMKKKTSAGANPEIAKLDKARYVVAKEPPKDQPLQNSVIKDFTGGGNISARKLYSSNTSVKLCLTLVMECNEKPPFSEAPKDADIERINDIIFGSKFSVNQEDWDTTTGETNHIYKEDTGLKGILVGSVDYKNAMLNILLLNLLQVKAQGYAVDYFKPKSVKERSLAYLQNSYDIHNLFISLFEKRQEENSELYVNWKGGQCDEDWSLAKIAQEIRKSHEYYDLPKKKQKEYSAEKIEEFFRKNNFYKSSIYTDTHKHTIRLRDWRLKPVEIEEEDN